MDVEQWARPTDPPPKHPAGTFGKRAELAGWRVEYRAARGPVTTRRRPADPDERGKYALVSVTTIEDTIGVRAQHPDGRRIAAWWIGTTFGEAWVASPRSNARRLGIRALTKYLTEPEDIEEETVNEEQEQERREVVAGDAIERLCEITETQSYDVDAVESGNAWVDGFIEGHAAAADKSGDAYGEGYAAGLAAALNHKRVWVSARRRLDALRPGDVILGKGDRWWTVTFSVEANGRSWKVSAASGDDRTEVFDNPSRRVDVVEAIATADALAALKAQGIEPERVA